MEFIETCGRCEGRSFVYPHVYEPDRDKKPPRTEWCRRCDARGWLFTDEGAALLQFVAEHLPHMAEYREGRAFGLL